MSQVTAQLRAQALSYARRGWPVAPLHTPDAWGGCDCARRQDCAKPGKHPRTRHGFEDATTHPETITRWWSMWPHAGIAIDLEGAHLVDVAPDSEHWLAEFRRRGLPRTFSFSSGGGAGHEHHLFARPDNCPTARVCRRDEFDLLSLGYCVAPPSLHASGLRYAALVALDEIDHLPIVPLWAVDLLRNRVAQRAAVCGPGDTTADEPPVRLSGDALELWHGQGRLVHPDDRSLTLVRLGTALARGNASRSTIIAALADRDDQYWRKYVDRADRSVRYAEIADRGLAALEPGQQEAPRPPADAPRRNPTVEARRAWAPWTE
jgi:hypothetical protein